MKIFKKIDILVLKSFIGPFILTYLVVDFVLLVQMMLSYTDELVGKDVGMEVFGKMLYYFALALTPMALPLAILLASLITFGNLGEHFELTALKSAGVSLVRVLLPIGLFAVALSVTAFWFNNNIVPYANLKAYTTLYNIRTTKASLDLKEGSFYNGIPNYSIKVAKKYPDGKTLKDIIIYKHTSRSGNREVIIADSALMYTIRDGAYLILELFRGNSYTDHLEGGATNSVAQMVRNEYKEAKMVFNLSSFKPTDIGDSSLVYHPYMKNVAELSHMVDSTKNKLTQYTATIPNEVAIYHSYFYKEIVKDSAEMRKERINNKKAVVVTDSLKAVYYDQTFNLNNTINVLQRASAQARSMKSFVSSKKQILESIEKDKNRFYIEYIKKYTFACACFIMFLIGAPLGSIIKKGGLGVPTLVSVFFFIVYYVLSMTGEKWAKESIVPVEVGMWAADVILFFVGLMFLNQARNDSRMFDKEAYTYWIKRLKQKYIKQKQNK